jgi:cell division protein FtsB
MKKQPNQDPMMKLESEEIIRKFRQMQRKADKYQSLFRICAAELYVIQHPEANREQEISQVTYLRSEIVRQQDDLDRISASRDEYKVSTQKLRETNMVLRKALASSLTEQEKDEQN